MKIKLKMLLTVILDLAAFNASLWAIEILSGVAQERLWALHFLASLAAVILFWAQGIYTRLWRFAGLYDYLVLFKCIALYICALLPALYFVKPGMLSWPAIVALFCLTCSSAGGWRLLWRLYGDWEKPNRVRQEKPALIVGAGGAGLLVARTLKDNRSPLHPVGFVDDDSEKQGMRLMGLPIMGARQDIPGLAERYKVEEIIIAMPSAGGEEIRKIVELCRNSRARLKILPSVYQIIGGKIPEDQIRDIQVEDLLNREPVKLDIEKVGEYIRGRVVMVTGAGGSVGSELCMQLSHFEPGALVLLGRGENSIYEISGRLASEFPGLEIHPEIGDVRDKSRMDAIIGKYRPVVVFHAAAHKHVPLMEKCPAEAFKNNVLGTYNIARAAMDGNVETFVLISTDKAVNPTSVMGATKRMGELLVRELNDRGTTRFVAVRFGNVLGSRGSVIPLFKRQIAAGGPVTVTHPEMVRYFMTISEAAQLVIEAGAMARGGELFVLDMGEPVKIVDLAMNMIKLSGYRPNKDISIKYTGIRPGEKLYEELFGKDEKPVLTDHHKIFKALSPAKTANIVDVVSRVDASGLNDYEALRLIKKFVDFHAPEDNPAPGEGDAV